MLFDAFGFQLPPGPAGYLRLAGRTILFDQLIALPIGLVLSSVGPRFLTSYLVASVYAQSIGILCAVSSRVALPRLDGLSPARTVGGVVALYFACGVIGAEVARHMCAWLLPAIFDPRPAFISWAIGATVALLVGIGLTTVRTLRARVLSTELEALQARINPHFLFNTLNSIAALIREDPSRAEAMTLQLSALFRYTLTAPRRGLVTLDEELTIVEGYLAIEQARLGPRLSYAIDVDPALRAIELPALTIQPLVENAIKHGIAAAVGGGSVGVRGWRQGTDVHFAIRDTGGAAVDETGTGEGLENVRRRLRATFGSGASVTLERTHGQTEARLRFPLREARA